jgi:hypothetical protein
MSLIKFAPETVTGNPPDDGPEEGSRPVTTGVGRYEKAVMLPDNSTSSERSDTATAKGVDRTT